MEVRQPAVSGIFYSFEKQVLEKQLAEFFSKLQKNIHEKLTQNKNRHSSATKKQYDQKPNCVGVVSPHAGYVYSGQTAAAAIASLKPAKKFIILGPNHYLVGAEFSIMRSGIWKTPLGNCKIASSLAEKISCNFLEEDKYAHVKEHSIEVQLPFLQYKFKNFGFVPISIAGENYSKQLKSRCIELGNNIADLVKEGNIGVIASSDFSHYLSLEQAKKKDNAVIEKIKKLDISGFFKILEEIDASVCGYAPIAVLMQMAKKLALKPKIIDSSSSADVTSDKNNVVTYYAIGFYAD